MTDGSRSNTLVRKSATNLPLRRLSIRMRGSGRRPDKIVDGYNRLSLSILNPKTNHHGLSFPSKKRLQQATLPLLFCCQRECLNDPLSPLRAFSTVHTFFPIFFKFFLMFFIQCSPYSEHSVIYPSKIIGLKS